jgi:hypothetical protein
MTAKKKRSPEALLRAIKDSEIDDDLAELEAMSDEELDRHIASSGGDPAAIRARGEALAKELLEKRVSWRKAAVERLEAFRAEAAALKARPPLPRAELLARIASARQDPRFDEPVSVLFQKKTAEASTDEELQALVDAIDLLAKLQKA